MHLHLCDICGGKLENGAAAVLTLAPQLPADAPQEAQSGWAMMQILSAPPLRQLEFCRDCLRSLLAIKGHVDAVRPPSAPPGRTPWGSIVIDRLFKDPLP